MRQESYLHRLYRIRIPRTQIYFDIAYMSLKIQNQLNTENNYYTILRVFVPSVTMSSTETDKNYTPSCSIILHISNGIYRLSDNAIISHYAVSGLHNSCKISFLVSDILRKIMYPCDK